MELQQLRYVVAVAETGGFTRAAERCLVVQSALSHQIAKLEKELGARLFERNSRRVRLTAAGEAFLPAARQALAATERAQAEVAAVTGEVRGTLSIGAIATITAVDVPSLMRSYHDRYPQVTMKLIHGNSDTLVRHVRDGRLDLGLLGVPPSFRADTAAGLDTRTLAVDRHVAFVAPDHPLAAPGAGPVPLERIAGEPFVDFPAGLAARAQAEEAFAAAGLRRTVEFEANDLTFIAGLVRCGLGITLLPSRLAPRLHGLAAVELQDGPVREERLAWNGQRRSPAAAAFLSAITTTDAVT
ncbi:LysR family transcriptional regulator [Streptomyces sp. SID5785]|uniref:LysR family transcriptional regulator n=1 Tax=Streptomyces sp. SID5785 TaxID=2690309 RepID=UPI0013616967|nr:LysR family transcriptional regulator [Streptomyces sp. SID5785]MZD07959.1 LysR family transcriptional regulator [Streptomyces sp. SID5785]MZD08604.1 LysR family transcriptional regulator [Streptomyces sp. SID5785]